MRVVVTGGGTGGHIFPAIAVSEALSHIGSPADIGLLYIGGSSGMEAQIVPAAGIPFKAITARKMPAALSAATARGLASLVKGYLEARSYLREFRADLVIGTGGYAAAATVLAAAHLGIPTMILENNVVAGRTNLRLGRFAKTICVSFEETIKQFPPNRCVVTGMPLRAGIVAPPELTKERARSCFAGLFPNRFTVLVIGGSQGARAINGLILGAVPALAERNIQILHQAGPTNAKDVALSAEAAGLFRNASGYVVRPFIQSTDMPAALRSADLIVCRGGISTLSEATANGLAAVIIPLPTAYADHQTANARAMERLGTAICRPEATLTADGLADEIIALCADPVQLTQMAAASRLNGRPHAAEDVARLACDLGA